MSTWRRLLYAVPALVLAGGVTAAAYPSHDHHHHHPGHSSSGISALRHATDKYHTVGTATADGYQLLTDTANIACIADMPMGDIGMGDMKMGMGGMGYHLVKGALVADPAEHALSPEAVIYRLGRHGSLELAAVEYVVIKADWDAKHASPPRLFGHRFNFTDEGNRYGLPPFYSLHVWAWDRNPAGTFAPYNPRVHCPG